MIVNKYGQQMTSSELRALCIKHDWFTNGDVDQYNRLFDMLKNRETPLSEIVAVIWICSRNDERSDIMAKFQQDGFVEAQYRVLSEDKHFYGAATLEKACDIADEFVRLEGYRNVIITDNNGKVIKDFSR